MSALIADSPWLATRDGDPHAYAIFRRHYSFHVYADGRRDDPAYRNRRLFVGPGDKLVLLTPAYDALFVWRRFIDASGQQGVNCAVFRNEGDARASTLILAAEEFAEARWGGGNGFTPTSMRRRFRGHAPAIASSGLGGVAAG